MLPLFSWKCYIVSLVVDVLLKKSSQDTSYIDITLSFIHSFISFIHWKIIFEWNHHYLFHPCIQVSFKSFRHFYLFVHLSICPFVHLSISFVRMSSILLSFILGRFHQTLCPKQNDVLQKKIALQIHQQNVWVKNLVKIW